MSAMKLSSSKAAKRPKPAPLSPLRAARGTSGAQYAAKADDDGARGEAAAKELAAGPDRAAVLSESTAALPFDGALEEADQQGR